MGGRRGDLRAKADLTANSIAAYGEARLAVAEGLTAIGGIQFTSGRRKSADLLNHARSSSRTPHEWSPKLGLPHEPAATPHFYAHTHQRAHMPTLYEHASGPEQ